MISVRWILGILNLNPVNFWKSDMAGMYTPEKA